MKIRIPHTHKLVVVLFWMLISFVFWIQFLKLAPVGEATLVALCICSTNIVMNHFLSNCLLKKAIQQKRMLPFFFQFLGITPLITFLTSLILAGFRHLEHTGVFAPSYLFVEGDSLPIDFIVMLPGTFVISLSFCGLRFYYEYAKVETINHKLQFKTLQEQITPHFMFNVLNHIHILMQENVEMASSLLIKYSDILRYQLYQGQKELIQLKQEIHFLTNYIEVEQIRWENRLEVSCSWEIEDENIEIPPLLLIIFIENAFKHVAKPTTGKGYVYIDLSQTSHTLQLKIENSRSTQAKAGNLGMGLENVRKRLDILFPRNYSLNCHTTDTIYSTQLIIKLKP